jgi:uncharacterized protein YkwD
MLKNQLTGITMACAATIVALGMFGQTTAMGQDAAQQATFRQTALAAHNATRAMFSNGGVQPLTESDSLNTGAQEYAMRLAELGDLVHSPRESRPGVGENLAVLESTRMVGPAEVATRTVGGWAGEAVSYDYNRPGANFFSTGHFTQMVWKSSTTVGCGYAIGSRTDPDGTKFNSYYVVCRYSPSGNVVGQYEANVLSPNPGAVAGVFQWPLPINDVPGQYAANVPIPNQNVQADVFQWALPVKYTY